MDVSERTPNRQLNRFESKRRIGIGEKCCRLRLSARRRSRSIVLVADVQRDQVVANPHVGPEKSVGQWVDRASMPSERSTDRTYISRKNE